MNHFLCEILETASLRLIFLICVGSGLATAYMEEIMELLEPIGMTSVKPGAGTPDLGMWDPEIPKGSLDIDTETYFWYHHTHGKISRSRVNVREWIQIRSRSGAIVRE